ncbi:MAG: response regulator transcription factor [Bacteroidia bacterium]|nr:response regulator transcription factor [Bacteroidia bacterium]MCF8426356.1 response regulator transcription factor [Bacteroidia bacterium]MCF8445745.1 response regulator transcription factor [Bacteroidia bacterium]
MRRAPITNISITDDNEVDLHVLATNLKMVVNSEVVLKTMNGVELVTRIKEFNIDVAIIDYKMPLLNGIQTARLLLGEGFEGKIIVCSHGFSQRAPIDLEEMGAHAFCQKEQRELSRVVSLVLKGEKFFDNHIYEKWQEDTHAKMLNEKDKNPILATLDVRELKIIKMMSKGMTNELMAKVLKISVRTMEGLVYRLSQKIGKAPKQIPAWAFNMGLLDSDGIIDVKVKD